MARPSSSAETVNPGSRRGAILFKCGRNETVAAPNHRLEILGLVYVILEGSADFADRGIDSLLDIDEHILAPQFAGRSARGLPVDLSFQP